MQRDIINQLIDWKKSADRKPLIITGVRQCGKTYIMKRFGEEHFSSVVYVNLEKHELAASVFEYDYDVRRIIDELQVILAVKEIILGETLLILDEIQSCPRAITALKYFCEDMRELHIVCAGSLFGVALKHQNVSFPVGKVNRLRMYPMSFKEFLNAIAGENIISLLSSYAKERPLASIHESMLQKYYRDYLIIGGMPEAVAKWITTQNYEEVEQIQDNILDDYSSDFAKHAPLQDVPKLHWIWESVPKQLAKENNKFIFSQVKAGKRAHELENALQWLVDAGLVYKTELAAVPELPLSFAADATYFKIYMCDVGLLRRKSNLSYAVILSEDNVFSRFKGAFAENYVHNELLVAGYTPYFWRSGNTAEIDFLVEALDMLIPIEVKAADNVRAKSYRLFCSQYHIKKGFKISQKNIGINKVEELETINLPQYMMWKIDDYIKWRGVIL